MRHHIVRLIVVGTIFAAFAAHEALAWETKSRRAITGTALQMLRRHYSDAFKGSEVNYESDLIRGALDGPAALRETLPMATEEQLINSIGAQINQLRHARQTGVGSYFAYRMGVLSALVGDYFLPFAGDPSPRAREIVPDIREDLEKHLPEFRYQPSRGGLHFIRYPNEYFRDRRKFFSGAEALIMADYAPGGTGYNGYLKKGGEAFFANAVEAITDVWHTVLQPGTGVGTASDEGLVWYLVDEIEYLLSVKKNLREAERVLERFQRLNRNDFEAYEKVADYFYGYGGESGTDQGLRLWETSLTASGPERRRVLRKLAAHYMREGDQQFQIAMQPNAPKDALQKAKTQFLRALEYDRTSKEAADKVRDVQVEIEAKIERQQFMMEMVSSGQELMRRAQAAELQGNFESALPMYERAIHTFGQVGGEFEEQSNASLEGADRARTSINKLINTVIDQGRDFLNSGDDLLDLKKFNEAISEYRKVEPHVAFLDGVDLGPGQRQELEELTAQSKDSVNKAEQQKRRAAAQAQQAPPGGAPAAPAAPGAGNP
jgi:tetratricopeptide (TPR) repeat protein